MATLDADATFATFHCPLSICSSVSRIADAEFDDPAAIKLVCTLGHAYWVVPGELKRVTPYWPVAPHGAGSPIPNEIGTDHS